MLQKNGMHAHELIHDIDHRLDVLLHTHGKNDICLNAMYEDIKEKYPRVIPFSIYNYITYDFPGRYSEIRFDEDTKETVLVGRSTWYGSFALADFYKCTSSSDATENFIRMHINQSPVLVSFKNNNGTIELTSDQGTITFSDIPVK